MSNATEGVEPHSHRTPVIVTPVPFFSRSIRFLGPVVACASSDDGDIGVGHVVDLTFLWGMFTHEDPQDIALVLGAGGITLFHCGSVGQPDGDLTALGGVDQLYLSEEGIRSGLDDVGGG